MIPLPDDVVDKIIENLPPPPPKLQPIIVLEYDGYGRQYCASISRAIPEEQVNLLLTGGVDRAPYAWKTDDPLKRRYDDVVIRQNMYEVRSVNRLVLNAIMMGFKFDNAQDYNEYRVGRAEGLFKKEQEAFVTMTYNPKT